MGSVLGLDHEHLCNAVGMAGTAHNVLFDRQEGWKQVSAGEFEVNISPGCERVFDNMTKRYVAETHAQSASPASNHILFLSQHGDHRFRVYTAE
jgi:2-methylcitrate dehydratase